MGEITVEVDGVEHTYATEDFLACVNCDHAWVKFPDKKSDTCPECGEDKSVRLTAERITDRPKWLWDGAASIEEMVSRTEHKANILRKLQDMGWTVNEPPKDGYAHLSRSVEEKEDSDEKEVTLSEQ